MFRSLTPALFALILLAGSARALAPSEILIVANKNVPDSKAAAEYYCLKRGVPKENVVYLDLNTIEDVSRTLYDTKLAKPLRDALAARQNKVKLILTTYGVPLRVGRTTPSDAEKAELVTLLPKLADVAKQRDAIYAQIKDLQARAAKEPGVEKQIPALKVQYDQLVAQWSALDSRRRWITHYDSVASVDSELANLWAPATTEYRSFQRNPLYFRVAAAQAKFLMPTVMTCRLDGPSLAVVKGLVDQAIAVEAKGLTGKAYFDARGLKYDARTDPNGNGYAAYDESLRETAAAFSKSSFLTVLDNKPTLFAPDSCPDCALYCGWYSQAKYVASNKFVPGAVGYHLASSEAISLRRPGSTFWCKRMLDDGVAATLGPVAEPGLSGFPRPAEFFGFLGTGTTLAEAYWSSNPSTSWMMVLVGDPLYRPFAKSTRWKLDAVKPSPAK